MCLKDSLNIPSVSRKGYGFKVVCPTNIPDEFTGRWPYFTRNAGGCNVKERHSIRNGVTWKLGRMYRVKHHRITYDDNMKSYTAGVHLFKKFSVARSRFSCYDEHNTVLVCYYTSGKHRDRTQIVAMRCTPLLALSNTEQKDTFESLIKTYGIKDAILVYQKRYAD